MSVVDFDGDGDFDISVSTNNETNKFILFQNKGKLFNKLTYDINGNIQWLDIDGDGDLDLLTRTELTNLVYINNLGSFIKQKEQFVSGETNFGDFNNDGGYEFFVLGFDGYELLKKTESGFHNLEMNLNNISMQNAEIELSDFNKDGKIDVILGNMFYLNSGNQFKLKEFGFNHTNNLLYDYDSNGVYDIIKDNESPYIKILENIDLKTIGYDVFNTNIKIGRLNKTSLFDINSDGYLDVFVSSYDDIKKQFVAEVFFQKNKKFINSEYFIKNLFIQNIISCDMDGDNDVDMIIATNGSIYLYRNDINKKNQIPTSPLNLQYSIQGDSITFSWDRATDAETPDVALTYNLRIGTADAPNSIKPSESSANGFRLIPKEGNVGFVTEWTFYRGNIPDGDYTWAVQAVDNSNVGSEFAESTFTLIGEIAFDSIKEDTLVYTNSDLKLNWSTVGSIDFIDIDVSSDNGKTFKNVVKNIPNTNSYNWKITPDIGYPESDSVIVKLSYSLNRDLNFKSKRFKVRTGTLSFDSQNEETKWILGKDYTINWSSTGNIDSVYLDYSFDDGVTWTNYTKLKNTGSFIWSTETNLLSPSTYEARLRIQDSFGREISTENAQAFTIKRGELELTSHRGNENIQINSSTNITWETDGSILKVKIEYSLNNGSSWNVLESDYTNSGTYFWQTPTNTSDDVLVRISDFEDDKNHFISPETFKLISNNSFSFQDAVSVEELGSDYVKFHLETVKPSTVTYKYGDDLTYSLGTGASSILKQSHDIEFSNLTENTTYYVEVSATADGETIKTRFNFTTGNIDIQEIKQSTLQANNYSPTNIRVDDQTELITRVISKGASSELITNAKLFVRKIGTLNYQTVETDNSLVFNIPASITTTNESGFEYYFTYEIEDEEYSIGSENVPLIGILQLSSPPKLDSLPAYNDKTIYQIVSVPFHYSLPQTINQFLTSNGYETSNYDKTSFRLLTLKDNKYVEYDETMGQETVNHVNQNGLQDTKAFFITSKEGKSLKAINGARTLNPNQALYKWTVPSNEWTLVGNPYAFNFTKNDLFSNNPLIDSNDFLFYGLNDSGVWKEVTTFEKYKGLVAYNKSSETKNLIIPQGRHLGNTSLSKSIIPESFNFKLSYKNEIDNLSKIIIGAEGDVQNLPSPSTPFDLKIDNKFDIVGAELEGSKEITIENQKAQSIDLDVINLTSEDWLILNPKTKIKYQNTVNLNDKETNLIFAWGSKDFLDDLSEGYINKPKTYALTSAYPNPFNPTVTIEYQLPVASKVTAVIYNVLGKKVKTIAFNDKKDIGLHSLKWHGVNEFNQSVASGIYFLKLAIGGKQFTRKLVLIK